MSDPTVVIPVDVSSGWNIGSNPNGGYLLSMVLAAIAGQSRHADPLSVTTHYLRPGLGDEPGEVRVWIERAGRSVTTVRASLRQADQDRMVVTGAFGTLPAVAEQQSGPQELTIAPPAMPAPDDCPQRSGDEQGVELPLLDHLDIRIHPDQARAGQAGEALVSGWIRFTDGRDPQPLDLPLFADAFPPSLFGLLGAVGWVPTIELTVHVRRRPVPGWIKMLFRCDDLCDGRMVEDGTLWDESGQVVARARQLGIVRT